MRRVLHQNLHQAQAHRGVVQLQQGRRQHRPRLLVFTNKRIISIDVQGLTGLKKSFAIMPYSKVQFFTIQTPGFAELVSDSELYLMFSNGFTAKFEFRGSVDIGALGRTTR